MTSGRLPAGCSLRRYRPDDARALIGVGLRSTRLLAGYGYPELLAGPLSGTRAFRAFARRCGVIVAEIDGDPVAYAAIRPIGRALHLKELAVDPSHGRRGIGSTLLAAVLDQARRAGYAEISLTTFRDVPFNAPFYAARGFEEVSHDFAPEALWQAFLDEVPPGIRPETRVLMLRRVNESGHKISKIYHGNM